MIDAYWENSCIGRTNTLILSIVTFMLVFIIHETILIVIWFFFISCWIFMFTLYHYKRSKQNCYNKKIYILYL